MKKHYVPVALIAATLITATAAKRSSDPVLMTVNGKDVPVSEFVYLYEKNNKQQAEPQTLDQYVDMFVNYKLKVADAEAAGLDTTAAFQKEYVGYCNDLAKPYLTDSTVIDTLRRQIYDRMRTSRKVSHIMASAGRTPDERRANRLRLDSIRTAILNGADFGEMAVRYSYDRAAQSNRGSMGWIDPMRLPIPFSEAAYSTPVGQISEVIDDTPYGYHIIRVEDEQPSQGQVRARHILKITRGLSEEDAAVKKAQIDSLYNCIVNGGEDFGDLAARESEDSGSARRGGELDWFGVGMMVPEFEQAAFSLKEGEISKPFTTAYGYHIVQNLGHRGIAPYEEAVPQIDQLIARDIRSHEPRKVKTAELRKRYGVTLDRKVADRVNADIRANGGLDSAMIARLAADYTTLGTVGKNKVLVSDVAKEMPDYNAKVSAEAGVEEFDRVANYVLDNATTAEARSILAATDPAYRNLINEYRDGILLFEISNRNVWDKANKDREGLEEFFKANRDKYRWEKAHYKGIVISATSDSIIDAAKALLSKRDFEEADSIVPVLRDAFGRNIKVERKVFPKGGDPVIDYLGFGEPKPEPQGKWTSWFLYDGAMLIEPEDASDVRVAVINDYQQWLEKQWLDRLHKSYKVKINGKELKKLRK